MLFQSILAAAAMLGSTVAVPAANPGIDSGVGNNYYYMGCYGYTLQSDPSVVRTKYSYGATGGATISTLQDCEAVCRQYPAWIAGGGNFCYCLKDRSIFDQANQNMALVCRSPCPGNANAMCGGAYGSGMFSLFEQA